MFDDISVPRVDNAPRKPTDEELPHPQTFDELVFMDDLERDSLNVREEKPSPQLAKDIKENGFVNPLITRCVNGNYLITDGFQRYQAGCRVGFTHFPVEVYTSKEKATSLAESHSRGKEWGDIEDYNQDRIRVEDVFINERGLSKTKAIEKRAEEVSYSESTVERNVKLAKLPEDVGELLKEPSERMNGFHDRRVVKSCINESCGTLNKRNAEILAKEYINAKISKSQCFRLALRAVKESNIETLRKAINKVADGQPVRNAFAEAVDEVADAEVKENGNDCINIGMVYVGEEDMEVLHKYVSREYNKQLAQYLRDEIENEIEELLNNINKSNYKDETWVMNSLRDFRK